MIRERKARDAFNLTISPHQRGYTQGPWRGEEERRRAREGLHEVRRMFLLQSKRG